MEDLTDKQRRFCEEYLVDLNATQAAIRAGYSEKTANEQGSQNLAKLSIQNYVAKLMQERSKRTQITSDRVLREVANIAFSNMRDFLEFDSKGIRFKDSLELTDEQMAIIGEVKQKVGPHGTSIEFKTYCKDVALYNLMRHLGLYEKDNDQSATNLVVKVEPRILNTDINVASSENDVDLT